MMLLLVIVMLCQALNMLHAQDDQYLRKPLISFSFKDIPFIFKDSKALSLKMIYDHEVSFAYSSTVYVNGQQVKENPLADKEIKTFALVQEQPLIVTKEDPSSLYHVVSGLSEEFLGISRLDGIRDAGTKDREPLETSGIIGMSFGASGTQENISRDYFFAAVKGHDTEFGQIGGGISVLRLDHELGTQTVRNEKTKKDEEHSFVKRVYFNPLDAHNGHSDGNCAYPIDNRPGNENKLTINDGLDQLVPNVVDMHWSPFIRRLFIAVQVKTKRDINSSQGANALLVGRMVGDSLHIEPFAPHDVLAQLGDTPISCMGSSKQISLHKVRTVKMSTGTLYLIGIGGCGSPEGTKNNIFALPLVDRTATTFFSEWSEDPEVGTLANSDTQMTNLAGFAHTHALKNAHEFNAMYSMVGANERLPGDIVDMEIAGDSVWVTVRGLNGEPDGIFESFPIFNEHGAIAAWTPWKCALPCKRVPLAFHYLDRHRIFQLLDMDDKGVISSHKTGWLLARDTQNEGEMQTTSTLSHELVETFSPALGGIQAIQFFDSSARGISIKDRHAGMIAASGYQKVFLALTEHSGKNIYKIFQNDSVLNDLGPISAITCVTNSNMSWLIVGGIKGLAVLCDEFGHGIRATTFEDFVIEASRDTYRWKKIGAVRGVQKLIGDGDSLFVVTRTRLDRIDFSSEVIFNNAWEIKPHFDIKKYAKGAITDVHIAQTGALVGTTSGLFITDVSLRAVEGTYPTWQPVEQMFSEPVIKLYAVQNSAIDKDEKLQVYVLVGSVLEARSHVYRFYFENGVLKLVPYKEGQDMLLNCKAHRRSFCAEGAHLIMTKAMARGIPSVLQVHQLLPPNFRLALHQTNNTFIAAYGPYWTDLDYAILNTVTGHFMVCGNGGIYVRE
jgi:hypothetical protein